MNHKNITSAPYVSGLHLESVKFGFVFACTVALLPSIALPFIFFAENKDRDDRFAALRQDVLSYMKNSEYGTIACDFHQSKHTYCAKQLPLLDDATSEYIERGVRDGYCILSLKQCSL